MDGAILYPPCIQNEGGVLFKVYQWCGSSGMSEMGGQTWYRGSGQEWRETKAQVGCFKLQVAFDFLVRAYSTTSRVIQGCSSMASSNVIYRLALAIN